MTPKERVLAVLQGNPVDRIPVDIWHTPEVYDGLAQHFGITDDLELYGAMGLDKIVWVFPAPVETGGGEGADRSIWGAEMRTIDTGAAIYQEYATHPLLDYDTPESLDDFPCWPDADSIDYAGAVTLAQKASAKFATIGPWVSFYEIYCQLRGLEQAMMDLLIAPDYVEAVLDRVEACQTAMMKRFFEEAKGHIDLCFISDDMGSQNGLLMSLDMWDRYFRDRMRRWCDLIHSYGVKVFFHSDGACEELVPRLIDVGIDVLNPIQHRCPGMDMGPLKENYGGKLVFHGGVDNQDVLPFGTADDVRQEVRNCLQCLGADGRGFICCSCHNIQPGTPVENILTMVETVKAEG